jgi:hypothetical protein
MYGAKVKLHGTNAGVIVEPDGIVTAMSRSALITVKNDNMGFAKWVDDRKELFAKLASNLEGSPNCSLVVFGEWCGPGVQQGVAINAIKERVFAVFAMNIVSSDEAIVDVAHKQSIISSPGVLRDMLDEVELDASRGCYVLPWFNGKGKNTASFTVEWHAMPEQLEPVLAEINANVLEVETNDPWVKKTFGIDGVGEGLVFYPIDSRRLNYEAFKNLCFKAKGAKHQNVAKSKPAQADPSKADDAVAFAALVVTPARLEQGARFVSGGELTFEMKNIGPFMKWMTGDIDKETKAELEASGLSRDIALKACSQVAKDWYVEQARKL